MTIFIVFGTTGEYSDRTEWPVKAFRDEQRAKDFVELLTSKSREIYSEDNHSFKYWSEVAKHSKIPEDPNFRLDYTGTSYYYVSTQLENGHWKIK